MNYKNTYSYRMHKIIERRRYVRVNFESMLTEISMKEIDSAQCLVFDYFGDIKVIVGYKIPSPKQGD